ncbi:MAG TPA: bifunctional phosphopantothenoylcysteine decarboxylase/phosphopantothenate--cysteine ligase CoaBC [Dermatophilaceae bacterium]|nr:bifunctional phosphopantothenoylcysteine decarboxylase/phosphopantothenate--cysteine ligase CoaBC [Dermatophilaceae bacterium]
MRVVLGVSGGIAAYKAASLLRLFREAGHEVVVVPTEAALRFVGEPTWAALSGQPVATDVWTAVDEVRHVRIGQQADLVVVAPATADLLARAASGQADDLLTATLLTARCPVVFAPAMHTEMWEHPATRANVATLRARGATVVDPASGRLTGTDTGPGRLPEPAELYAACLAVVEGAETEPAGEQPLAGVHVLVTAGGTREPLDPVRFLGNRSSGKQGMALAEVALQRGARVTLVACNLSSVADRERLTVVPVESALDLEAAVREHRTGVDVIVMCAAVADFRPKHYAAAKIKKSHGVGADGTADDSAPTIELVRNPDILAGLVADRGAAPTPLIVGFAAETGDESGSVLDLARAKLARKGCDLLVANEVGVDKTFGADTTTVHILRRAGGPETTVGPASKHEVAAALWDVVGALLPSP